jgi:hypothetical protein
MFLDVRSTPGPCRSGAGQLTGDAAGAVVVGAAVVAGSVGAGALVEVVVVDGPEDAPAVVDGSSLEHATRASSAAIATIATTLLAELRRQTV